MPICVMKYFFPIPGVGFIQETDNTVHTKSYLVIHKNAGLKKQINIEK